MPSLTRAEADALGKGRRRRPPPRREQEIVREILRYLATVPGVTAWRMNTGAMRAAHKGKMRLVRFGRPGTSDIIGWIETAVASDVSIGTRNIPRWFAVEVKRPGQKLTAAQTAFLDALEAAGGVAIRGATCVEDVWRQFAARSVMR